MKKLIFLFLFPISATAITITPVDNSAWVQVGTSGQDILIMEFEGGNVFCDITLNSPVIGLRDGIKFTPSDKLTNLILPNNLYCRSYGRTRVKVINR